MICDKVGTRELFTLGGDGVLLRGTYHKTTGKAANSGSSTGVVFLSALASPRSLTADSAVFWANSFADRGYPSFRTLFDRSGTARGRNDHHHRGNTTCTFFQSGDRPEAPCQVGLW